MGMGGIRYFEGGKTGRGEGPFPEVAPEAEQRVDEGRVLQRVGGEEMPEGRQSLVHFAARGSS
jgi:hypothetical protein